MTRNGTHVNCMCVCSVTQLCPTLCNSMDCSPPGSTAHEILQARILEWEQKRLTYTTVQGFVKFRDMKIIEALSLKVISKRATICVVVQIHIFYLPGFFFFFFGPLRFFSSGSVIHVQSIIHSRAPELLCLGLYSAWIKSVIFKSAFARRRFRESTYLIQISCKYFIH